MAEFLQIFCYFLLLIVGIQMSIIEKRQSKLNKVKRYCENQRKYWCGENCIHPEEFCEKRYCYPIRPYTDVINLIEEKQK